MKKLRITLKNYRCFSEQNPARFELSGGFIALVGSNNSGKSALMSFFYEYRELWNQLSQSGTAAAAILAGKQLVNVSPRGLADPIASFCNLNSRPLSVEVEIVDSASVQNMDVVKRIVAICGRENPHHWRVELYGTTNPQARLTSDSQLGFQSANVLVIDNRKIDVSELREAMLQLSQSSYYGSFRNAINQGANNYLDLQIGTAFVNLWNTWKNSGQKAQMRAIGRVTDDIRRLFGFERLEINKSDNLNTLMITVDHDTYRLEELGAGLSQFIIALGNAATTPASFIFIDEPETNLHPALQIDFLMSLSQYAKVATVFSTHSIGLARSVADSIYSIQKTPAGSLIKPFEATPNYLEFVGELSFSTFKDLGSDRLLLVEGVTDVKTIQQLLRLVKKEHETVVLPLGGDQLASDREHELSELKRISNNIVAIVDSEKENEGAALNKNRQAFSEICKKLGFRLCLTERRAIENYFTDKAVKAALGDSYSALQPYELLRAVQKPWGKNDNWKIARQMTLDELKASDIGKFLEEI